MSPAGCARTAARKIRAAKVLRCSAYFFLPPDLEPENGFVVFGGLVAEVLPFGLPLAPVGPTFFPENGLVVLGDEVAEVPLRDAMAVSSEINVGIQCEFRLNNGVETNIRLGAKHSVVVAVMRDVDDVNVGRKIERHWNAS